MLFYYHQDFTLRSKQNFISFLMLNEETLLKNFKFIKEKLVEDTLINYSTFELNEIVHLLNKHQNVLLRDFKQDLIQRLEDSSVQLVTTTTHAPFAERTVRTFKSMSFKRIVRARRVLTKRVSGKTRVVMSRPSEGTGG